MMPLAALLSVALAWAPVPLAAQDAPSLEDLLARSAAAAASGNPDRALQIARQAAQQAPQDARARAQCANAALAARQYALTIDEATQALRLGGETPALFQLRSQAQAGLGRHEAALADAEKSLSLNPQSAAGMLRRAEEREALGRDLPAALDDFRRASELDRSLAGAYAQARARMQPPAAPPRRRRWAAAGAALVLLVAFLSLFGRRRRSRRVRFASLISIPPASGEPRQGQVVGGRYIVGKLIDRRPGELLYEGRDLEDRPRFLRRYAAGDARRRLNAERARAACALKHPAVAGLEAVFQEGGCDYVAHAQTVGESLARLLERSPQRRLDAAAVLPGVKAVCEGLEAAHEAGLLHGRLTPEEILTAAPSWQIRGFGLPGPAPGDYLAPEAAAGETRESDLYALGACLFEALCGQRPFSGPEAGLNKREGRLPAGACEGLPPGFEDFFARSLQPDPARRFHGAGEILGAYRSLVSPAIH